MGRPSLPSRSLVNSALAGLALLSCIVWGSVFVGAWQQIGQPFAGFRYGTVLRVSPWNESSWNGIQQGLVTHDLLVEANGQSLHSADELTRLVQSVPVGTPVRYTYDHKGKAQTVSVETQRFGFTDFALSFLPSLLISGIFLLIGIASFLIRPGNPAARAHLLMTLSFGMFLTLGIDNDTNRWFDTPWFSAFSLACFLPGSSLVHLALTFPREKRLLLGWPSVASVPYVLAFFIVINLGWLEAWVPRFLLFALWTAIGFVWFFANLIRAVVRPVDPLAEIQARAVLLGASVAFLPGVTTYFFPVIFGDAFGLSSLPLRIATLCTILFPLSIGYTIVRHHLFDIELVIKRTLSYGLVTWVLGVLYFGILWALGFLLGESSQAVNALATAIVALLFAPVRDRTKSWVDRRFFRRSYDFQQTVTNFGERSRESLGTPQLLGLFTDEVNRALQPDFIAILTRPEGIHDLVLVHSQGLETDQRLVIPADRVLSAPGLEASAILRAAGKELGILKNALCFPLRFKGELVGCVLIGPRKSQLDYGEQDRLLLLNLTQQLSMWIKNAQLFSQLSRRAAELEQLVKRYEEANVQAMTDPLTGLNNRRAFQNHLGGMVAEARRSRRPLSIILFDIDHFKRFNDTWGHAVGDQVLSTVAQVLSDATRLSDISARWGGEEFVVALPGTGTKEALIVAERIRTCVAAASLMDTEGRLLPPITVSLGLSLLHPEDDGDSVIHRADRGLYVAKSSGRNQVQTVEDAEGAASA